MSFTATELSNIFNAKLDHYLNKGTVFKQNIQNKPLMKAFEETAGNFTSGKGNVSLAVKSGQGGGSLAGYTHDDAVGYYNPATIKRLNFPWKEHHIGIGLTHTELKIDGITVIENGGNQSTGEKDGREEQALADLLDEKVDDMGEDYAVSWNSLLLGDGTSDTKALAGVQSFILADPSLGSTGGLSRSANTWFRNRAATAAAAAASSGNNAVTSSTSGGGALLQFLQKEMYQLKRYEQGGSRRRHFAGSDFINAMETELRANGNYTMQGFSKNFEATGDMSAVSWGGVPIQYDPTLDGLSLAKRMYSIDFKRVRLLYMSGEKMKKTMPARPYDRYVMYRGLTSTAVMVAQQLNTSGVYDIV